MALEENTNGNGFYMPVAPAGGYGNGGFGGDWAWIIILLLAFNGGWGGFGGGYGNMALGYDFPWLLNGQNQINANTNAGFDHAATQAALGDLNNTVTAGFGNVATQLCGGFAGVNAAITNAQMADMNRSFALQSQFADCCCENRLGIADLKYTVATENCADRAALSDGIRDVIASQTASTQRILDQLCADRIAQKDDTIAQLRQELLYSRGQASQIAQTANVIDGIYNRLDTCPVGTTPVYGRTPIFSCNNNCGCGCGNGFAN